MDHTFSWEKVLYGRLLRAPGASEIDAPSDSNGMFTFTYTFHGEERARMKGCRVRRRGRDERDRGAGDCILVMIEIEMGMECDACFEIGGKATRTVIRDTRDDDD